MAQIWVAQQVSNVYCSTTVNYYIREVIHSDICISLFIRTGMLYANENIFLQLYGIGSWFCNFCLTMWFEKELFTSSESTQSRV